MNSASQSLETLQDIKKMMEKSSRFISLSGWSGISAGMCALLGAFAANNVLMNAGGGRGAVRAVTEFEINSGTQAEHLEWKLLKIAVVVFAAAFTSAFLFTWLRSRKAGIPIWGTAAKRLLWNTVLPMATGGLVIIKMIELGYYDLIPPFCLIFYGLSLVNGSKYTLGEVKYLGYAQIILGMVDLWFRDSGLICWALGFGVFHIVYGIIMWWKYERVNG